MGRWGKKMGRSLGLAIGVLALSACAGTRGDRAFEAQYKLAEVAMSKDIAVLASEEFMGRRPATLGETKTLDYMQSELERAGLVSGTNDPSNPWRAPVPLVTSAALDGTVVFQIGDTDITLADDEAAALTGSKRALVEEGALVFVGKAQAAVADDQVLGKVAVLQGEPGKSPARREKLFEQGAAAVITIVESTDSIENLQRFSSRERFQLASELDDNLSVFVTRKAMQTAFADWDSIEAQADDVGFAPIALPATVRIEASSDRRDAISHNLIGKLPGTRPEAGAVLMLAHWDHFGECGEPGDKDRLCNGAADNASGVAAMLELARRLSASGPHDRDIFVLGTTAEEWGLLGAQAFTENPPVPLDTFVAAFNFDTVAIAPRGSEIGFIGEGETALDPLVVDAIKASGREQGSRVLAEQFLRRQDGWALLQRDVPTVMVSSAFGNEERLNTYLETRYHNASDEVAGMELGGAVEDLLLHEGLIEKVANASEYVVPAIAPVSVPEPIASP